MIINQAVRAPENFRPKKSCRNLSKKCSSKIFRLKLFRLTFFRPSVRPKIFRPIIFRRKLFRPKIFRPNFFRTTKTKRLVDGRAGAHRPNAINERFVDWCGESTRDPHYSELSTTRGSHLGIGCHPGMATASAVGRLQDAAESHLDIHLRDSDGHPPTNIKW